MRTRGSPLAFPCRPASQRSGPSRTQPFARRLPRSLARLQPPWPASSAGTPPPTPTRPSDPSPHSAGPSACPVPETSSAIPPAFPRHPPPPHRTRILPLQTPRHIRRPISSNTGSWAPPLAYMDYHIYPPRQPMGDPPDQTLIDKKTLFHNRRTRKRRSNFSRNPRNNPPID
ncbi:Homeobox protein araucanlike [Caligus rogercresseyi]|uniref:Homeobox protein araucanlike n=1 Tax=Caligus rogercresseyi TaxID=217165 RepID=A0A7T8GQQ2_CALRO|nr:Homeobox protein araucanlike [Caligus rogercresseyi]